MLRGQMNERCPSLDDVPPHAPWLPGHSGTAFGTIVVPPTFACSPSVPWGRCCSLPSSSTASWRSGLYLQKYSEVATVLCDDSFATAEWTLLPGSRNAAVRATRRGAT